MKIKVFGERNTGTNYLEKLISSNSNATIIPGVIPKPFSKLCLFLDQGSCTKQFSEKIRDVYFKKTKSVNFGWKHSVVDLEVIDNGEISDTLFICLVKNPYSWAISLYKNPYHSFRKYNSFQEFISQPWKTVDRENGMIQYPNIIEMWNDKVSSYFLIKESTIILRYEDLLRDPSCIMPKLISRGIKFKYEELVNIEKSTKEKSKTNEYYKSYYLNELWKDKLSPNDIEYINQNLRIDLMQRLGYERL